MMHLDILVDVGAFEDRVRIDAVQRAAHAAIEAASQDEATDLENQAVEMSVRVTGDEEIHALNRIYRGVDRPTDVLSFALQEGEEAALPPDVPVQLGDVIVSYPYAARQAAELEHSVEMEMAWLVIHGTLQLLGYHHEDEEEAQHMESIETVALRSLGFRKG
jgi:probable rRNA maturation factor